MPSSSVISSLPLCIPANNGKEKLLLPHGRLAGAIKPSVGSLARTSKGGNDLGGGKLGKQFSEGHGRRIARKNKSAMQKRNSLPSVRNADSIRACPTPNNTSSLSQPPQSEKLPLLRYPSSGQGEQPRSSETQSCIAEGSLPGSSIATMTPVNTLAHSSAETQSGAARPCSPSHCSSSELWQRMRHLLEWNKCPKCGCVVIYPQPTK